MKLLLRSSRIKGAAMERVNAEKKLTRRVPSVAEMTRMIECAAALEPMVEY